MVSDIEDKKLQDFGNWVPSIIFYVGLTAFLLVIGIYGITGGEHSNSGTIGDTIGGVTAPIIGLLSSVLIYFSFKAQIRANEITREQSITAIKQAKEDANFRYLNDEYEKLQTRIDSFRNGLPGSTLIGIQAIEEFSEQIPNYWIKTDGTKLNCLKSLKATKYFLRTMQNTFRDYTSLDVSSDYKNVIRDKMNLYFNHNLAVPLRGIEKWSVTESFITGDEIDRLSLEITTIVTDTISFLILEDERI